jgi:hypothetical protein
VAAIVDISEGEQEVVVVVVVVVQRSVQKLESSTWKHIFFFNEVPR